MKQKRWIATLLTFILLIACIPTGSARADELADGQIIADGVYYIQNVYSEYYMQIANDSTSNNAYVCHADKNFEDKNGKLLYGTDYDLSYMWSIKYVGNGKYTIYSMNQLNMQLNLATFNWSIEPVAVASYNTTSPNPDGTPVDILWSIMCDKNGYIIMQDGDISKTLFAQNINRSVQPTIVASEYDENIEHCHWSFINPTPQVLFYSSSGDYLDNPSRTIIPEETKHVSTFGFSIQPVTNFHSPIISITSSNPDVATVNTLGEITGLSYGSTTITISYTYNGQVASGSFSVNVAPLAEGTYYIRNKKTGQYLDYLTNNAVAGGTVALYDFNGNTPQQWTIESRGGYSYTIRQASGDLYLGVAKDSSSENGLPVILRKSPETEGSQYSGNVWAIIASGHGAFRLYSNASYFDWPVLTISNQLDNSLDTVEQNTYTNDNDFSDEWEFIRTYPVNVQVFYDNYVSAYADDENDGITNIQRQLNTLKTYFWENFAISINICEFRHRTTYLDYCRTLDDTGTCQCRPCINNYTPYKYPEGHHTNIWNILYHLPLPEASIDATIQYIGHETCVADDNCVFGTINGVCNYIHNLIVINNIARGDDPYDQVDCTRTLVHEVGHLFYVEDHYGDGCPSTEELNNKYPNTSTIQYDSFCNYGEDRFLVAQNLTLCDVCRNTIERNKNRYKN